MPAPLIRVIAPFFAPDETTPATGKIELTLTAAIHVAGDRVYEPITITGVLDPTGNLVLDESGDPVLVVASDPPGSQWAAPGVPYRITTRLNEARSRSFEVFIAANSPIIDGLRTADLTTLVPAATPLLIDYASRAALDAETGRAEEAELGLAEDLSAHETDLDAAHPAASVHVAPGTGLAALDVQAALAELVADDTDLDTELAAHEATTTNVHGVAGALESVAGAQAKADAALAAAEAYADLIAGSGGGGLPEASRDQPGGFVGIALDSTVAVPVLHVRGGPAVDVMHPYFATTNHLPGGPANTMQQRFSAADVFAAASGLPVFIPPAAAPYVLNYDGTNTRRQFVQTARKWFSLAAGLCTVEFPDRDGFDHDSWGVTGLFDLEIEDVTIKGPTANKGRPFTIVDRGVYDPAAVYNYADKVAYTAPGANGPSFYAAILDGTTGVLPTDAVHWVRDRGYSPGTTVSYGVPDADNITAIARTVGPGHLTLRNVWLDGWFINGISLGSGNVVGAIKKSRIEGGRIQAWSSGLLGSQNAGTIHELEVIGTEFRADPLIYNSLHHHAYINPNVSKRFERCRFFDRKGGWSLHFHGTTNEAPRYEEVTSCWFDASNDKGMIPSETATMPVASGNWFMMTGQCASISGGGHRLHDNEVHGVIGSGSTPKFANPTIELHDNRYFDQGRIAVGGGTAWDGSKWRIHDEKFDVNLPSGTSCITSTSADADVLVESCSVLPSSTQGRFMTWNHGRMKVIGCDLAGSYINGVWWPREPLSDASTFRAENCDMSQAVGPSFATPLAAAPATVGRVVFDDDCTWPLASPPTATLQGTVQCLIRRRPANQTQFPASMAAGSTALVTSTPRFGPAFVRRRVIVPGVAPAAADLTTVLTAVAGDSTGATTLDPATIGVASGSLTVSKSIAGVAINENVSVVNLPAGGVGAAPNDSGAILTLTYDSGTVFTTLLSGVDSSTQIELADPTPEAGPATVSWSRTATDASVQAGQADVFSVAIGWNAADVGATGRISKAGPGNADLVALVQSVNLGAHTGHFATNATNDVELAAKMTVTPTIVSAATIMVSHNNDVYDLVAGTVTTVTTILVGGTAASHRTAGGRFRFRMDGTVAFGTGGNMLIRPKANGKAPPAGTIVEFEVNPLTGLLHQPDTTDGGTVLAGLADAAGDMVYASGDDTWQKVAIAPLGKVWGVTGAGSLGWITPSVNLPLTFHADGPITGAVVGAEGVELLNASTIVGASFRAAGAPATADALADVNVNGGTVFANQTLRPKILVGATQDAAIAVPDNPAAPARSIVTVDIDEGGGGSGFVVTVFYREN